MDDFEYGHFRAAIREVFSIILQEDVKVDKEQISLLDEKKNFTHNLIDKESAIIAHNFNIAAIHEGRIGGDIDEALKGMQGAMLSLLNLEGAKGDNETYNWALIGQRLSVEYALELTKKYKRFLPPSKSPRLGKFKDKMDSLPVRRALMANALSKRRPFKDWSLSDRFKLFFDPNPVLFGSHREFNMANTSHSLKSFFREVRLSEGDEAVKSFQDILKAAYLQDYKIDQRLMNWLNIESDGQGVIDDRQIKNLADSARKGLEELK